MQKNYKFYLSNFLISRDELAFDRRLIFRFFQSLFLYRYSRLFYYKRRMYLYYFIFSLNHKFFFKNLPSPVKFSSENVEFINIFAPRNYFLTYRVNKPVRSVSGGLGLDLIDRNLRSTKFYQIKLIRNNVIDILALGGLRVNVIFNNMSEKLVSFASIYSSLIINSNRRLGSSLRNSLLKVSIDNNLPHGSMRGCRKPSRKKYLQKRKAGVEF